VKANKKIAASIIIAMMATSTGYSGSGPGTTAVNFLNIGVSARSGATGGAFSAISDGPVSAFYNPAGLARIENTQIAGMHSEWLGDLRYEYLGFASPIKRNGGLGISFSYLTYGRIAGYSETNESIGNIGAYDMAATLSYGHMIRPDLSIGVGFKSFGEKLDNVNAFGIAGDFGFQYNSGRFLTGVSVMNFGPRLKYETSSSPLPTTVNAGASVVPIENGPTLMIGAAMPFSGGVSFKAGLEYSYQNLLVLRSGYDSRDDYDGRSGVSFGGGLNLSSHSLDYAYNINSMFGGTHQISFVFRFGQARERADEYSNVMIEQEDRDTSSASVGSSGDDRNARYFVCAAKYGDKESAIKHIKTLKMFGVSAKLVESGGGEFRVLLKEVKGRAKAEKVKKEFERKRITCYIEKA